MMHHGYIVHHAKDVLKPLHVIDEISDTGIERPEKIGGISELLAFDSESVHLLRVLSIDMASQCQYFTLLFIQQLA